MSGGGHISVTPQSVLQCVTAVCHNSEALLCSVSLVSHCIVALLRCVPALWHYTGVSLHCGTTQVCHCIVALHRCVTAL